MSVARRMMLPVGALFVLAFAVAVPAPAQAELLFGQDQAYSVTLRGNGEAVVYARLSITNRDDQPRKSLAFDIPRVRPSEIVMYQAQYQPVCVGPAAEQSSQPCILSPQSDSSVQSQLYPYPGAPRAYKKASFTNTGNRYEVSLPTAIEANQTGLLFVAYAADGYVQSRLGLSAFTFETFKTAERINRVQVAIDVDSDLVIKGGRSGVDYNPSIKGTDAPSEVTSQNLDEISNSIGTTGAIVKTARSLAAGENLVVRGEYATSWWRLYLGSMVLVALVLAALILLIYFISRFWVRRRRDSQGGTSQTESGSKSIPSGPINLPAIWTGLASAGLVVALSLLARWLSLAAYRYGFDPAVATIGLVIVVLLYILAFAGPPLLLLRRQGWPAMVYSLIAALVWLILLVALYLLFFQDSTSPPNQIYPQADVAPSDAVE